MIFAGSVNSTAFAWERRPLRLSPLEMRKPSSNRFPTIVAMSPGWEPPFRSSTATGIGSRARMAFQAVLLSNSQLAHR